MIGIDEVRRQALALPEMEESTHFGLPSFEVRGKGFVTVQKGHTHAIASVDRTEAEALAAEAPEEFEAVWRSGSIFVGVRIALSVVSADRLAEVIGHAWRHRAPKRLAAAHPAVGDGLPFGLARPAQRALTAAGYTTLGRLTTATEQQLSGLHGVGPSAVRHLRAALELTGRAFADS